jgi:hypothetical protein
MSNEERQRQLREAGHRGPAEAEKESKARAGKEAMGRQEGELRADRHQSTDDPTPAAEEKGDPPRPRR